MAGLSLVFSPMGDADLDEVLAIEQASFTEPWTRKMFLGELRGNAFATNLVVRAGRECETSTPEGTLLGYVMFWIVFEELHLMNLAVCRDLRRRGIATRLVHEALERAADAHTAMLEVRASNEAALALYDAFGFQRRGVRRGYYDHPHEDAVIMVLEKGGRTMLSEDPMILDRVRRENGEFKKMEQAHQVLEDQLAQLSKLHILTPEEEVRKKQIQFDKLAAKDKMAEIVRQYKQHRPISA